MAFLKLLLLSSNLISIIAFTNDYTNLLTISGIVPYDYNITFIPFIKDGVFYGECNIAINIRHATKNISFFSEHLSIIDVMLINSNTYKSKQNEEEIMVYKPSIYSYNNETHITNVYFVDELLSRFYDLNIYFTGIIAENLGGFRVFSVTEEDQVSSVICLAATHFQLVSVREIFPCFNVFSWLTFNISIKHNTNYRALSNMPVDVEKLEKNNIQWTHFKTTPLMSTGLVSVVLMTNFDFIRKENENVRVWCRKPLMEYALFMHKIITRMALYLENEFKFIREISKVDYIAIPAPIFYNENMLTFGIVVYRETDVMIDKKLDTILHRYKIVRLTACKMIYEWLNTGSPSPFMLNNYTLNDGFVTFLGMHIINKIFPNYRLMDLFVVQDQQEIIRLIEKDWFLSKFTTWFLKEFDYQGKFNWFSIGNDKFMDHYHSIKTTTLLRMFQYTINEKRFWKAVKSHFQFALASVSRQHFWTIMQTAFNESYPITPYIIINEVDYLKPLKNYITLLVTYDYKKNVAKISLDTYRSNLYVIPISYTTQRDLNFTNFLNGEWLVQIPNHVYQKNIILASFNNKNNTNWIIANLQAIGCLRVKYDAQNWQNIVTYLNSKNYMKIHALNRAQIVDDVFYFAIMGQLDLSIFVKIIKYLKQEKDYIVWYPMLKAIEYMSCFFSSEESKNLKSILSSTLIELYEHEMTYGDYNIYANPLIQEIIKWACTMGHSTCLSIANNVLISHLLICNKCLITSLEWAEWKQWTFCNGIKIANNHTWSRVFSIFIDEQNNEVLKYLTCSEDPVIVYNFIVKIITMNTDDARVKMADIHYLNSFYFIITRYARKDTILDFILTNLESFKPRFISLYTVLTVLIDSVYSENTLLKIKKFLEDDLYYKQLLFDTKTELYKNYVIYF
ncbi:thyrotropin-releasing hormone-degrading ectoenzyme-like isoform X2 [Anoplolepis gracilipes]|uniref:thyrotropin-releasing hormone-degrading ectoenzyme-like isoform X2 n=1 Tax=Anoplolepis gracilipes TaxID=354296 RepID=UPI003B9F94A4